MKAEELIDKYILKRLDKVSREKFEKELTINNQLKEEVLIREQFLLGIESIGRAELKTELKSIHKEVVNSHKSNSIINWKTGLIITGFILSTLAIIKLSFFSSLSNEKLYLVYYEPYKLANQKRSGEKDVFMSFRKEYNNKQFANAISNESVKDYDETNTPSEILLSIGVAHLELDNYEQAIKAFDHISKRKDFNFEDEVTWYKGLLYLKKAEYDKSIKHINKLAGDPMRDHSIKAQKLANQIKQKLN